MVADSRTIGLGSTCASTALLQYKIDTPLNTLIKTIGKSKAVRSYKLCEEAIYKLDSIAKEINLKDFTYKKSLHYTAKKKDVRSLKDEFLCLKENGFKVSYLEKDEIKRLYKFKSSGAILSDLGAQTDAYLFAHYLHQYGLKKGLEVYDRTCISKINHNKSNVIAITENGHDIKARKLVYATGYEVVKYLDKKIVNLQATYVTISQSMEHLEEVFKDNLLWNTADPYLYLRSTKDKRIMIGGRDETVSHPDKMDRLISKKTKQLVSDFNKLFKKSEFIQEFSWTGIFGSTQDGQVGS